MRKKRTLNYCKQYVIFDEEGNRKTTVVDLFAIKAPEDCDAELYAARVMTTRDDIPLWTVIDGQGERITEELYEHIDNRILGDEDGYAIIVRKPAPVGGDSSYNAIALDGQEIFKEGFSEIAYVGSDVCIVADRHKKEGLADLSTGRIIVEPRYNKIRETANPRLFAFHDYDYYTAEKSDMNKWGLLDADGNVLFEPQFISVRPNGSVARWKYYNVVMTAADPDPDGEKMYHYLILDWNGKKIDEEWSTRPFRNFADPNGKAAENVFIFFEDDGNVFRRCIAKVVLCDYNDWADADNVYEYSFSYRDADTFTDLNRIAYDLISMNGLRGKIQ